MFCGIDDTDSRFGMCTTYIAAKMIRDLKIEIKGFPRLVRLNPNIPFKTRGNGAVAFEFYNEDLKEKIVEYVFEKSHFGREGTNPGVVFLKEKNKILEKFSKRVLHEIVLVEEAKRIAERCGGEVYGLGNMRGIVGALASVGMPLKDVTYEVLAYRFEKNFGKKREIEESSVIEMDKKYYPKIWDSYDYKNKHICIAPASPCPVFFGIRGENPEIILEALKMIRGESFNFYQVFKTNQSTDSHLEKKEISEVHEYNSVILRGKVTKKPETIRGGHVIFQISDSIWCAAFEPTKEFRGVVRKLMEGDEVEVYGGVRDHGFGLTVNLEKLKVLRVAKKYRVEKPLCPNCGRKMKSIGHEKGYRCKKCHTKQFFSKKVEIERDIREGFYEVPPVARRHLAKPLCRTV